MRERALTIWNKRVAAKAATELQQRLGLTQVIDDPVVTLTQPAALMPLSQKVINIVGVSINPADPQDFKACLETAETVSQAKEFLNPIGMATDALARSNRHAVTVTKARLAEANSLPAVIQAAVVPFSDPDTQQIGQTIYNEQGALSIMQTNQGVKVYAVKSAATRALPTQPALPSGFQSLDEATHDFTTKKST